MARTILIENTTVSAKTWIGQLMAASETFDIPEHRMSKWANDATVITDVASGDLKVIKSTGPTVYYSAADGQRVLDGLSVGIAASGADGEYLCTNATNDLVWAAGAVVVKEEGTTVTAGNCSAINFVGSSITATDAGGGQVDVTVVALMDILEDTTPQLGGMLDVNGNSIGDGTIELLKFVETGSAVNEITITNAATGNGPSLSATGVDTNVNLVLTPKGTGVIDASTSVISNVTDPIAAQDAATKAYVDANIGPTGLTDFHEVWHFYEQGATGDLYMMRADSLVSKKNPGHIALANGRIVHATSTREKSPEKFCDIVVRKQTAAGTAWSSGTWSNVGTVLLMNNTILSDTYTNLTSYTFNAGDAIAVYLDKTTPTGGASCESPFVALYVKYD